MSDFLNQLRALVRAKAVADFGGDLNRAKLVAIEGVKSITPGPDGLLLADGITFRCGLCLTEHRDGPVSGVGLMYWCETCRVYRFAEREKVSEEADGDVGGDVGGPGPETRNLTPDPFPKSDLFPKS